jgi:hypothetical protein
LGEKRRVGGEGKYSIWFFFFCTTGSEKYGEAHDYTYILKIGFIMKWVAMFIFQIL